MKNDLPEPMTGWAGIRADLNEVLGTPGYCWVWGFLTAMAFDTWLLWSVLESFQ